VYNSSWQVFRVYTLLAVTLWYPLGYVHYTICYILYTLYYILYTLYYILYTLYYILHAIYYILSTIYYILYYILYTLYHTLLHSKVSRYSHSLANISTEWPPLRQRVCCVAAAYMYFLCVLWNVKAIDCGYRMYRGGTGIARSADPSKWDPVKLLAGSPSTRRKKAMREKMKRRKLMTG